MSIAMLTSMFPNGFGKEIAAQFCARISCRSRFAYVASDFDHNQEKTDRYCKEILGMFSACGIPFAQSYVVDGRMTCEEAAAVVKTADVIWLSGGDTPTEYDYLRRYGLIPILKAHKGVIIGMSAGALNMGRTVVCTKTCGHEKQQVYEGLGLVPFSIEPHFVPEPISEELLALSYRYPMYGLCDDAMIVCSDGTVECFGEVYCLRDGNVRKL